MSSNKYTLFFSSIHYHKTDKTRKVKQAGFEVPHSGWGWVGLVLGWSFKKNQTLGIGVVGWVVDMIHNA